MRINVNKRILKLIGSALFMFIYSFANCQNPTTDSLNIALKTTTGIERIDLLNLLLKMDICSDKSRSLQFLSEINLLLKNINYPKGDFMATRHFAQLLACSGKLDSSIFYGQKALDIAMKNSFNKEMVNLLSDLGYFKQSAGEFDSSTYYFLKCLEMAHLMEDSIYIGAAHIGLGTNQQHTGSIDKAIESYYDALDIAEKIDNQPLIITAKLNIATINYDHHPEKLKSSFFLDLLTLSRSIGDKQREISVLEWLGYLKADSGDFDLSINYFQEGIRINREVKDQNREILLLQGISYTYNKSGDHQKSINTNNEIIELSKSSGYELYLPSMYVNNVYNYMALEKFKEAIRDAILAIEVGEKSNQIESYFKVYPKLALAYHQVGNHQKAYEAQLKYSQINEEVFNSEKSKQLTEIETKYETEKKEAEIATLSQKAAIQELKITQRNQTISIGLVLFALILIIAFFVYRERSIKKNRIQTELEHRFLRSQLNPHFIFNALLAIQNFMLKNDGQAAALYLTKFSKLMRQILESSREEFISVEEEIEMLKNYMDIHQLRLQNSFSYTIKIADNIDPETDTIPPMFVQPFVENAIEHGIVNAKEKGLIELSLNKVAGYIHIEIKDNGCGLSGRSSNLKEHNSLATTIIKERMELFNKTLKDQIQLILGEIISENGDILGTKVELKVPFGYI
ncbi:MAG: tetratricopeptide (TPR) repeat protein [Cyclobacteriaceae bacterium]|jgi:tetratricopeptide (TPR) repeat protein